MSLVDFAYARPTTLTEAANLLAGHAEARPLAGGQTLIPTLKQRLARPTLLVDLRSISELRGIDVTPTQVSVGAMSTHAEVAQHAGIAQAIPALSFLAGGIAHPQVRHMGTIGGSVSNNDPAADYPAALMGLGAQVETDRRIIPADQFFLGLFSTALEPGELLTRVHFPRVWRAGYCKIPNPASGYVTAGAFVSQSSDGVRVAINGAGPCVFRHTSAEAALEADFARQALTSIAVPAQGLNNDMHATAAFRAHLVSVALRRALALALAINLLD